MDLNIRMSFSTWTKTGSSEKAQSSQTIRILIKSLQYLAEDASINIDTSNKFVKVASQVIKSTFNPSTRHNMNEQVQTFLAQLGWKNSQIKLRSADMLEIILGSNRYLDQGAGNVDGLELLIKTISVSIGSHILSREVDAKVDVNIGNKSYNVNIQAISDFKEEKSEIKTEVKSIGPEAVKTSESTAKVKQANIPSKVGNYDTSQIILPIINNRLPYMKLQSLLKDVIEEFTKSWYQEVPELNSTDEGNINILLTYIIQKVQDKGNGIVQIGNQIGTYFADAIMATYTDDQIVSQEILEGSSVGSIIRDIKARSLCSLTGTQSCGSSIGGTARPFCDISMGIWAGCLSKLTGKEYSFTGFYEAGKRDPYCLMELSVK